MRVKDSSIQCTFHPALTAFLFGCDKAYRDWGDELVITSGNEPEARHCKTSMHYMTPGQAADIRTWDASQGRANVPNVNEQLKALIEIRDLYCHHMGFPTDWIDIVVEKDHIHIEYQPKRID